MLLLDSVQKDMQNQVKMFKINNMLLESNGKSFQRKNYKNKNKPLKNRWKNTIKIMKHGKRNTILKTHLTKRANLKINMMIKNKPKEKNQKVIERK